MPGLFSAESLERIRAANDIVEVVGSVLPLKRAGANFTALCPFHKEKTPSFNVNPHLQIFHCFGCHKGGDVFTFIKEYENVDFPEAVRRLADRAKIPLEYERGSGEHPQRHIKDVLLQIHEQIAQRWQTTLANEAGGQLAREYLARRGVSSEAIKLFRIGAAPDQWDDTVNWARSKGFDLSLVETAGLILRRKEGEGYYDWFRGRLMFPICDEQGRVVGFSGRILSAEQGPAKYVNSPETPIFTKGKLFYGLDKSKRALLDAGFAVVCEGQLDLIACFTAGVQNVVAPQGTAFTADHARILKRFVQEVVLCFDSDVAGQNAALRSLDHLLGAGLAVRVAVIPAPHDPDSLIKASGAEAFKQLLNGAEGFFDYHLERLCANNDLAGDKGRLAVLHGMAEAVLKTANTVLIDKYAQKTALRLGVSPDAVRLEFRKASRAKPREAQAVEPEPAPVAAPASATEQWLLRILFLHEELVPWATENLDVNWIEHPLLRDTVKRRLSLCKDQTWSTLASFLDRCDAPEMRVLVTEAATADRPVPNPAQQLLDITCKLRNQSLDREMARLRHAASQPQTAEADRIELLHKIEALRAAKQKSIPAIAAL